MEDTKNVCEKGKYEQVEGQKEKGKRKCRISDLHIKSERHRFGEQMNSPSPLRVYHTV